MIRNTFKTATSAIRIPGTEVVPVPLFDVLDWQRSEDFVARVEPSVIGDRKMAAHVWVLVKPPTSVGLKLLRIWRKETIAV